MLPLLTVEPGRSQTRLQLLLPHVGPVLRARLPSQPTHDDALITFASSITQWLGHPVRVVIDADATELQDHPERWAALLSGADPAQVSLHWLSRPKVRPRDRFLSALGDFRSASRLAAVLHGGAL